MSQRRISSAADDVFTSNGACKERQQAFVQNLQDILFQSAEDEELLHVERRENRFDEPVFTLTFLQEKQSKYDVEHKTKAVLEVGVSFDEDKPSSVIFIKVQKPLKAEEHELYFVDTRHLVIKVANSFGVMCTDKNKGIFRFPAAKFFSDIQDDFLEFMDCAGNKIVEAPRSSRTALPGALPEKQSEFIFKRKL